MNALLRVTVPFILASESPRRHALLDQMDVPFEAVASPAGEQVDASLTPPETARTLATRKARPVAQANPSALVLAADTIVAHDGTLLEKPDTPETARAMLRRLSGDTHAVYTGLALHHAHSNRAVVTGQDTQVTFGALDDREIQAYVDTKSPMDKAGGYGIQDHTAPLFIDHLEGDYYTVMGLPLRRLYCTLRETFSDLLAE